MKNIIALTIILLFGIFKPLSIQAQNKNTIKLATDAIKYWEVGENTGNYADFKKMISPDFNFFSHPLFGISESVNAKNNFENVIKGRETMTNNLTFSDVKVTANEQDYAIVSFTSKGKVMNGQFDYSGYNTIAFGFKNNKIVSFREYLGSDDLLKFSAMLNQVDKKDIKNYLDTFFKAVLELDANGMSEALADDFVGIAFNGFSVGKQKYVDVHLTLDFIKCQSSDEVITTINGVTIITGIIELQHKNAPNSKKQRYTAVVKKSQEGKFLMTNYQESPEIK